MSPITIYFLLSSTDIREPIVLGRQASAAVPTTPRDQHKPPKKKPNYEPKYDPNFERNRQKGRLGSESKPLILNKPPT